MAMFEIPAWRLIVGDRIVSPAGVVQVLAVERMVAFGEVLVRLLHDDLRTVVDVLDDEDVVVVKAWLDRTEAP